MMKSALSSSLVRASRRKQLRTAIIGDNRLSRKMLIQPEEAIAYLFNEGGDEIRRAMFT